MKNCCNCGAQLPDDTKFCFSCGAAVASPTPPPPPLAAKTTGKKRKRRSYDNEELKKGVTLCDDGKYRWIYPFNMWTNPTILFLVYKIFFWIFVGIGGLILMLNWNHIAWDNREQLWDDTWPVLVFIAFFALLIFLSYAIVAGMYGGKYIILFTMDEHGINHEQIPEQAKKAQKLGAITALAGAASGRPAVMGLGINTAVRTSMYSDFASVHSVKRGRWGNVIKIREILSNNQVYVRNEDFDFVYNYIKEHCPKAK
jgi:hypothetical protein